MRAVYCLSFAALLLISTSAAQACTDAPPGSNACCREIAQQKKSPAAKALTRQRLAHHKVMPRTLVRHKTPSPHHHKVLHSPTVKP